MSVFCCDFNRLMPPCKLSVSQVVVFAHPRHNVLFQPLQCLGSFRPPRTSGCSSLHLSWAAQKVFHLGDSHLNPFFFLQLALRCFDERSFPRIPWRVCVDSCAVRQWRRGNVAFSCNLGSAGLSVPACRPLPRRGLGRTNLLLSRHTHTLNVNELKHASVVAPLRHLYWPPITTL